MKSIKIIWYPLMVFVLFAGLYSGRREFFLLFFVMLFVTIYALALNLWTAFSFSFIQELTLPSVVKGSPTGLDIGIYNDKPFPFTLMKILVETVLPDKTYELSFNLSPKTNISYTIPLNCPYRGVYGVGMTTIEINDIFGLVKTRFDMRRLPYYRQRRLKIFPRLVELPYLPARGADAKYSGVVALRLSEIGDSYSDLRRYRSGDPLKRVHKPISARRRELYVKNYDIPSEAAILVAIDSAMETGEGELARYLADTACECTVALTAVSLQSGFTVEFIGVDFLRPTKWGRKLEVLPELSNALAELQFDTTGDFGKSLELPDSKIETLRAAYIISTAEPAAYTGALSRLQRSGCYVCFLKISGTKDRLDSDNSVPGVNCFQVTPKDDIRAVMTGEQQ